MVPADGSTGSEVEARYIDIVRRVKASVGIPVSVKLGPFFSALGHLAGQLEGAGADGLVLFNRFLQRNIDLENLAIEVDRRLSTPEEIHLPLVWIALLSRRVRLSLAASRGVESYEQVVKYLLVGADVVMTTSALLRHGPQHLRTLRSGLERWLEENHFSSVAAIRGLKDATHPENAAKLLRADYVKSITEYLPVRLVS